MATIVDLIVATLREPEDRRMKRNLDRIVKANIEATGNPVLGFLYRGTPYRHSEALAGRLNLKAIDPSLYEDIEDHLAQGHIMTRDLQMIVQVLRPILNRCQDMQDIRDALPECLVAAIGHFDKLPRKREPAWMLDADSREMKQYLKLLPQIEAYTTARFLY